MCSSPHPRYKPQYSVSFGPTLVDFGPKFTEFGPMLVDSRPSLVDPVLVDSRPILVPACLFSNLMGCRPHCFDPDPVPNSMAIGQIRPQVGQHRPKLGRRRAKLPNSTEFDPISATLDPDSRQLDARASTQVRLAWLPPHKRHRGRRRRADGLLKNRTLRSNRSDEKRGPMDRHNRRWGSATANMGANRAPRKDDSCRDPRSTCWLARSSCEG